MNASEHWMLRRRHRPKRCASGARPRRLALLAALGAAGALLLAGFLVMPSSAEQRSESADAQRLDVQAFTTPTGMPVLLVERADGVVSFDLFVRTGSAQDPPDRNGLAYVAAQLLLYGVGDWRSFDDRLADLGARLEVEVEETTIVLHGEVLAADAVALLELVGQTLQTPPSDEELVAKVVRDAQARARLDREDDRELGYLELRRWAFDGHPLAQSPRGRVGSLAHITGDDVARFWRREFTPSKLILAVGGQIRTDVLERAVTQSFPPASDEAEVWVERPLPQREGRRVLLVDKPARSQNEIYIGKAVPPPTSEQWPALEVAITLLGGNFSARLTRELRSKRGWTYGVEARRLRNHEASLFYVWTFTAPDRALDSIELVLAELELLASNGPTPAEFERARGYTKGRLILSTDTPATLAREAGRSARFGLGPHAIERRMRELDELQGEDVVRVFAGLLAPHDLGIVMVCSAEHFGEAMGRLNGVVEVATEAYDAD